MRLQRWLLLRRNSMGAMCCRLDGLFCLCVRAGQRCSGLPRHVPERPQHCIPGAKRFLLHGKDMVASARCSMGASTEKSARLAHNLVCLDLPVCIRQNHAELAKRSYPSCPTDWPVHARSVELDRREKATARKSRTKRQKRRAVSLPTFFSPFDLFLYTAAVCCRSRTS